MSVWHFPLDVFALMWVWNPALKEADMNMPHANQIGGWDTGAVLAASTGNYVNVRVISRAK